ncbi:MAG TPA: HAMP domain-containing sensor histidine kinase [Solirubrobacteraceae bacterium]
MPLRRRVGLAAAAAVGIAIVLACCVAYLVVRDQLRGQVDSSLRAQAAVIQHGNFDTLARPLPGIPPSAGGPAPYVQAVLADGTVLPRQGGVVLPVTQRVLAVAGGQSHGFMTDVSIGNNHLREITIPVPLMYRGEPVVVQLARPLNSVDHVLSRLRLMLALVIVGGMALALVLGRLAARRVLAPLAEVADTAQHVGETEDLASRIHVHADDEVGQLATRFNTMLDRLETSRDQVDESVRAQRQLVADASHELRTPVTSMRTNVELLLADTGMPKDERRRILADVLEQTEELTALIGDLIELARGDLPPGEVEDVRLDEVVASSLDRARRNFPNVRFQASLEPAVVMGVPDRLGRAINNLLDNAARHSPPAGLVEVIAGPRGVRVRDHGNGVDPEDLPYVFDRFYRGASSRGRQGSGLGLAIVRQVADQHRGSVEVENAPDGGAVFTLRLPVVAHDDSADIGSAGRPDDPSLARGPEALA